MAGRAAATRARKSPTGQAELPQLPEMTVVTPCRSMLSAVGRSMIRSAWVWTSMKPGLATSPPASMTCSAAAREVVSTIRPLRMPSAPQYHGLPVPSQTLALSIR